MLAAIKKKVFTKELGLELISLLFIILFTYAAISKLLDYEGFKLQLSQSAFLSAYADFLGWGIPVIELMIAVLFFFPKLKFGALWSSFILMVIFTTYILIVLNFSDSIPCSCGAVLASLSWDQHLIINIGFTILAAMGVLMAKTHKEEIQKAPRTALNKEI